MKLPLQHIAFISSGVYATAEPDGDVYYLQARDITENHELEEGLKPQLVADGRLDKHFLQRGDLLIAAKGKDHYAVEYPGTPGPAVASTLFIVVRIKDKTTLLPAFLQWYLNLPTIQKSLANGAQGTALPVISKADVESLEIHIPPIARQTTILKIDDLHQQEKQLTKQLEMLKQIKMDQELLNALELI